MLSSLTQVLLCEICFAMVQGLSSLIIFHKEISQILWCFDVIFKKRFGFGIIFSMSIWLKCVNLLVAATNLVYENCSLIKLVFGVFLALCSCVFLVFRYLESTLIGLGSKIYAIIQFGILGIHSVCTRIHVDFYWFVNEGSKILFIFKNALGRKKHGFQLSDRKEISTKRLLYTPHYNLSSLKQFLRYISCYVVHLKSNYSSVSLPE